MDLFTHVLLGVKVAHASAPDRARLTLRERMLLGGIAAAFPDSDLIGFLINPLIFLADWHQGPTRSVLLLPQPFSPFNWKLIGSNEEVHYEAYLNLAGHVPLLPPVPGLQQFHDMAAAFRPPAQLSWQARHRYGDQPEMRVLIEHLWEDPRFAPFRRFAVYPGLSAVESDRGETCVWFTDLRYDLPVLPDTFRYGFCRASNEKSWQLYRLRYFSERARQRLRP